jgi:GT2 family glycosyltransferase
MPVARSVSAVVVSRDGGFRLERCVASLYAQDEPPREVVLVDDASSDDSCESVRTRFPELRVIRLTENVGPAAARNAGMRAATGECALLVDADMVLTPDCLRRLCAARARRPAAVHVPRVLVHPGTELVQADGASVHFVGTLLLHNGYRSMDVPVPPAGPLEGCLSSCLLIERKTVLDAGGFDEAYFMLLEDMEFGLRLRSFGHELRYVPDAVALHDWRAGGTPGFSYRGGAGYPERRAFMTMRNRIRTLLLHYRLRTLVVLAPALALYELATVAAVLRRGWLGTWLRSWHWQWIHARELRSRRRWIQQQRVLSDRDLVSAGALPFAPGFLRSSLERMAVRALSGVLSLYWWLVRPVVG